MGSRAVVPYILGAGCVATAKTMKTPFAALVAFLLLASCGQDQPRSAADIETAVRSYLEERTDLKVAQMGVRADRIRYEGDRALASVSITASDDPKATMKMMYELVRGANGWEVVPPESSAPQAGGPAEAQGGSPGLPPGHPPLDAPGGGLPPGHPPTTPQGGALPPGHPPIGGEQH